jgi:hypothetical protein
VLGVCSSTDEGLIHSLMSLHGETETTSPANPPQPARAPLKPVKKAKAR